MVVTGGGATSPRHVPRRTNTWLGAALVLGHDLFDRGGLIGPLVAIEGRADTGAEWVWAFLHERASGTLGGQPYFVSYPLIPWLGVMALGYVFANVLLGPAGLKKTGRLGLAMVASFVFLRLANVYGDPSPWSMQGTGVADTIKSFFNVSKYPPSLDYLLITLGISLAGTD